MPFSEFFGKPEVQNIASAVARGYLGSQPNGASTLASIDAQNRAKQAAAQRQSLFAQATQGMSPEQAAQFQLISQDGLDKSFAARFNPRDFERDLSTLKANNGADFLRARMAQQAGLKSQEGFLNPSELAGSGRIAAGLDVDAKSQLTEDGLNSRKELTETGLNRRADQTEAGLNSRKGAQLSFDERKHLADNALARSKYLEDVRQFGAEHALSEMKLGLERDKFENPAAPKAPAGYRNTEGGGLEYIPGGPADPKNKSFNTKQSEANAEIERLESIGIPRDTAIKIKENVYRVVTDPVTREAVVVDVSTGAPVQVLSTDEPSQQSAPATNSISGLPYSPRPSVSNAETAYGAEGFAKGTINAVTDAIGAGLPFPNERRVQDETAVLREQLTNDIASSYGRQPPSWLLKQIQELLPQAGSVFNGPDGARSKYMAIRESLASEMQNLSDQSRLQQSPAAQQQIQKQRVGVNAAIARIDNALGQFGDAQISADDAALINKYLDN